MADSRVADWGHVPVSSVRRERSLRSIGASNGEDGWAGDAPVSTDDTAAALRPGDDEFFEVLSEIRLS